jgi:hypothetical protein
VAAWVTHKYNPKEHYRGGNMFGVKEEEILNRVSRYIFIGNKKTHEKKPILDIPHKEIKPEWLVSRVMNDLDFIWIWEK